MKTPCKNCPFRRENEWHLGVSDKIMALKEIDEQKIFSCHALHPHNNVFSVKPMEVNDCAGYRMMLENMISKNRYQEVVNEFNETLPEYDLRAWAKHNNYQSALHLI